MSDEDIILQKGNVSIAVNMICAVCNTTREKITLTTATNYSKVDLRLCMLDEILSENEYFFICDSCFQVVCTCTTLLRDLYTNRKKGNWKLDIGCFICGSTYHMCKFKLEDDVVALMVITRIERLFKIGRKPHNYVCWSCDHLYKYLVILYKIIRLNPNYPGDEIAMEENDCDSGFKNKFTRVHLSAMNRGDQKMFFSIVKGHYSVWDDYFPSRTCSSCRNCIHKNNKSETVYSDLAGSVWEDLTYRHSYENDGMTNRSADHTLNGIDDISEDASSELDNGPAMIQEPPNPWIFKKPIVKHSKEGSTYKSNSNSKNKQRNSDEKQCSKEQLVNEESKNKANNTKPGSQKLVGHLDNDTKRLTTEEIFNDLSPEFWMNVKQLLIDANASVSKMHQACIRSQSASALFTTKVQELQPQSNKQEYLQTNYKNVRDKVRQINMKNLEKCHIDNVDKATGSKTGSIQGNRNTEIREYSKEEPKETDTAQEQLDYSYNEACENMPKHSQHSSENQCEKQNSNDHARNENGSLTKDDESQDDEDSLSKYVDVTEIKRQDRVVSIKQSCELSEQNDTIQSDSDCFLQKESQMSPEQEMRYKETKKKVRDCFTRLANPNNKSTKKRVVSKVAETNVRAKSSAELHSNNSSFVETYQNNSNESGKTDQQKSKKRASTHSSKHEQYYNK